MEWNSAQRFFAQNDLPQIDSLYAQNDTTTVISLKLCTKKYHATVPLRISSHPSQGHGHQVITPSSTGGNHTLSCTLKLHFRVNVKVKQVPVNPMTDRFTWWTDLHDGQIYIHKGQIYMMDRFTWWTDLHDGQIYIHKGQIYMMDRFTWWTDLHDGQI